MRCRNVLTRVDALRTGELEAPEHRAVRDHLKVCRSCDASAADVQRLASAAKELVTAPLRSMRDCCDLVDQIDDLWVAFSPRGLRMIHRGGTQQEFTQRYAQRFGRPVERGKLPAALRKQIAEALRGEGVDKPQLDLADAPELEQKVMQMLSRG